MNICDASLCYNVKISKNSISASNRLAFRIPLYHSPISEPKFSQSTGSYSFWNLPLSHRSTS